MAARNFGRVNVSIAASTGSLTKGLRQATGKMQNFSRQVSGIASNIRTLAFLEVTKMALSAARAVMNFVRSLIALGKQQAQVIDTNAKMARSLGLTYRELAGLSLAAELGGVSQENLRTGLQRMSQSLDDAQRGIGRASQAFARLGLDMAELQGMTQAERFEAIADALGNVQDPAERAALAMMVFGRSGAMLLPMFEGGAAAMRRQREEAERLGLALTGEQAAAVEAMNDALTKVSRAIDGIVQQIVAYLAPMIEGVSNQFIELVGEIGGANIGSAIGEALLNGAEYLASIGDWLIANLGPFFMKVFNYFSKVGGQWSFVFGIGQRVASAFYMMIELLRTGLLAVVFGVGKIIEGIVWAVVQAGKLAGFEMTGGDQFLAAMQGWNESMFNSMADAAGAAGQHFNDMVYGKEAKDGAGEIATPLTDAVKSWREMVNRDAAAVDEAAATPRVVQHRIEASTKDLAAIVVGTAAGEQFANSIARGADPRLEGQKEAERTADATERTADGVEALASASSPLGMATITV